MQITVNKIAIVGKDASATVKFQDVVIGGFHSLCEVTILIPDGAALSLADIPSIAIQTSYDYMNQCLCSRSEQQHL